MIRALVLTPEATADIQSAYVWYEEQRRGLGRELNRCLDTAMASACRMPEAYPALHKGLRRALARRFPYAAYFLMDDSSVTMVAVMHVRRSPVRWKSRR